MITQDTWPIVEYQLSAVQYPVDS